MDFLLDIPHVHPPVSKYCEEIQGKIEPLLAVKETLSDSDMEKFEQKDPESYPITIHPMLDNEAICMLLLLFTLTISVLKRRGS